MIQIEDEREVRYKKIKKFYKSYPTLFGRVY